jgi:hypothetical protein
MDRPARQQGRVGRGAHLLGRATASRATRKLACQRDDARLIGCDQVRLDWREFRSANCRWKAISFHLACAGSAVFLLPFLAAQRPGHEHVGQALRFCLSDLVIMKDVPARTCTANLLKLRPQFFQSCLLASIHRLVIRSGLSSRSAKSVGGHSPPISNLSLAAKPPAMAAIGQAARQPRAICDQSGLCRMRCAKRRSST